MSSSQYIRTEVSGKPKQSFPNLPHKQRQRMVPCPSGYSESPLTSPGSESLWTSLSGPFRVPPPRPPKPSYLTETPTKPLSGSKHNNSCTNDVSSKVSGYIFTHNFGKNDDTRKVNRGKTLGLESTSFPDSLNIFDSTRERTQTLPIIDREKKPKIDQFPSKTVIRLPITSTTFPLNPQPGSPPKITHKNKQRIIEGEISKSSVISKGHHAEFFDRINPHKVSSEQLINMFTKSPSHSHHQDISRCSSEMQYLDLKLGRVINVDYNQINQSNNLYNMIDLEKTRALIKTIKNIDEERSSKPL